MRIVHRTPPSPAFRFRLWVGLTAPLLLALPAPPADAQYFGRNKVLWEDFPFHRLETENFEIYYYPEDNPAIREVAALAEQWYDRLSEAFGHELSGKKPLILYNTHADFQQTTVTTGLIGEGTGGFTEPLRDRVVMPLTGVRSETDHVLGHELVHAFQFDIFKGRERGAGGAGSTRLQTLPLWMVEGLAEYLSQGREDPQTALWLRDAELHGSLPDLDDLRRGGRYSPYQFGQAFWAYVGGRWGDRAVIDLFLSSSLMGPEQAMAQVLGTPAEDVVRDWHAAVRSAYRPVLDERQEPGSVAERVLFEARTRGRLNVAPALSPDGRRIAFLSTRDLFTIDLFLADAETGEVLRKLVSADTDPHFDALRFIDSAGAWSPDGRKFAFVVFARGDNRISVVDVQSGRIERRIAVPGVGAISSPAWSPDGRSLAFSGTDAETGYTDVYVLDLESGSAENLTDDRFGDLQPAWSPDGGTLAFVSERPDRERAGEAGRLDHHPTRIVLLDLATRSRRSLPAFEGSKHIDPHFGPDGRWLYFIAEPDGVPDVFRYDLDRGTVDQLTRVKTGVSGITEQSPALSVAAATGEVAFSVLEDGQWNVYSIRDPGAVAEGLAPEPAPGPRLAAMLPPAQPEETSVVAELLARELELPEEVVREEPTAYRPDVDLAYVGPATVGVGVDRFGAGVGGSASAYFTDMLGEHQVGVALQGGTSRSLGNLLGGQVTYLNQQNRIQWGASALHVPFLSARTFVSREVVEVDGQPVPADVVRQVIEEVTVDQVAAVAQYPFSMNRRLELNLGYTHYGFDAEVDELVVIDGTVVGRRTRDVTSTPSFGFARTGVAYVGDRSFFGFVSPVRGSRYRYEVESTFGDLEFQSGLADYRRYFFFRPWTVAVRGLFFGRYGSDAEDPRLSPLYVGSGTLVRGYEVEDFDGSECTPVEGVSTCPEFERLVGSRLGVVNLEVRVPLLGTEEFGLMRTDLLPLELAVFADVGATWTEDTSVDFRFDEDTLDRVPVVSAGVALRTALGGFLPIQLYYAVPFQRPDESGTFGVVIAPGW
ncbi:MAG: BamA/TamA family outer membrane protein [Thermoanaerobaculia bacterium]